MTVPAAKVKALCNASEAELVRSSRPPHLKSLSLAKVKSAKARARKLADKWQSQTHKQVRKQKSAKGVADSDTNTELKAEIFRDALAAFEDREAQLEAKSASPVDKSKAKSKPVTKKKRAAGHRSARALVRDELALVGDALNRGASFVKKRVLNAAASVSGGDEKGSTTKKAKSRTKSKSKAVTAAPAVKEEKSPAKQPTAAKKAKSKAKVKKKVGMNPPATAGLPKRSKSKRVKVKSAAKQARIAESGKTTRVLGHVSARGKRSQARRDAKN